MTQVLKLDLTSFSRKWFKRLLRTVPTIVTVHIFCASQGRSKREEFATRGTGSNLYFYFVAECSVCTVEPHS